MRKIIHRTAVHNAPPALVACALALVVLSGCGGGEDAPEPGATTERQTTDCGVETDISAWTAFRPLADAMAQGQEVPRSDLESWAELPAVEVWRRSQTPLVPRTTNVANWLEGAWWDELGRTGRQKANADRIILGRNYRYSQANADRIDALLEEFTTGPRACAVRERAAAWIDADKLPATLHLLFLPTISEVRILDDRILLDTGVLAAGGGAQTEKQIVALLYRNLQALDGPNPLEAEGAAAVAECFRVMLNEAVASHLERTMEVEFATDHPALSAVQIVPEAFFQKTQQGVASLASRLPDMLADESLMTARGPSFARGLAGGNLFVPMGIAMAEVIVVRNGEEALRKVRSSVPDFLAAYQAAARANGTEPPRPGAPGVELADTVPPLPEDVYGPLHELLTAHFAATP